MQNTMLFSCSKAIVSEYAPHVSLLKLDKPKVVGTLLLSSFYKSIFLLQERMKTKQNISSASGLLWFLQLWITMYFPMFEAKQPKSTKALDHHAKDPTLSESLQIKSTTFSLTHFFIKAIFSILDDLGALWNPSNVDHVVLDQLKRNPLADLEAKVLQSANWGSIPSTRDLLYGVKTTSRYKFFFVEPYNLWFVTCQFGITQHLPMAFLTMTSHTSCPPLFAGEVKNIIEVTQWMLSLFKFHLFLLEPKEKTSFLNWWPAMKDAFFSKRFSFFTFCK